MREVTALAKAFMPEYVQPARTSAQLVRRTDGRADYARMSVDAIP